MDPNRAHDMLDVEDRYRYYPLPGEVGTAELFDELAERGRFDEHGGELSDDDWDNARSR